MVLLVTIVHGDFGLSWDESIELDGVMGGYTTWRFWAEGLDPELALYNEGHSPLIRLVYHAVIRALRAVTGEVDRVAVFHLLTALIGVAGFLGVYRLAKRVLSPPWALGAALLAVLSPRYVGNAFTNFKDLPFAVAWVFVLDASVAYALAPVRRTGLALGLALGALLALRLGGLIIAPVLLATLATVAWRDGQWGVRLRGLVLSGALALVVVYVSYPYLLVQPIAGLVRLLGANAEFPWTGSTLTLGVEMPASDLPRVYLPAWLAVTTPLLVLGTLSFGLPLAWRLLRSPSQAPASVAIVLGALFPLAFVIASRTPLYDGVRHVLFVLPPLCIVAVMGLSWLANRLSGRVRVLPLTALALTLGSLVLDDIRLHPYQSVWFNTLTGGLAGASGRFTLDYWALSIRESALVTADNATAPATACIVGAPENVLAVYLPGWGVEHAASPTRCPPTSHYIVIVNQGRVLESARGAIADRPGDYRLVHEVRRDGAVLGAVFEYRHPSSTPSMLR